MNDLLDDGLDSVTTKINSALDDLSPKMTTQSIDRQALMVDESPIADEDWLAGAFMLDRDALDDKYNFNRYNSSNDYKFTDTTMGGSISINVTPQFTRYCDPRSGGLMMNKGSNIPSGRRRVRVNDLNHEIGLGRYYSTVFEDNSTNIFFEFGFPRFNNVLYHLFTSVDYKTAVIANSGRSPLAYNLGKFTGTLAVAIAFPLITVGILVAQFLITTTKDIIASPGRFDHYYLQPSMFLYWSMVNTITTMMSTELGILSPVFMSDSANPARVGSPLKIDQEQLTSMRKLMPGLITSGNAINVHAMVSRAQIMHKKLSQDRLEALADLNNKTEEIDEPYLYKIEDEFKVENKDPKDLWGDVLEPVLKKDKQYDSGTKPKDLGDLISDLKETTVSTIADLFGKDGTGSYDRTTREVDSKDWVDSMYQTAESIFNEGARYAVFRVEHVGSTTDSFSNSTTTVGLDDKINSMGSTWRDIKFNIGGGEIPGLTTVLNNVTDFMVGTASGLTLGLSDVIGSFLAGSNIEVSKRWDDSTASLATHTFKMKLRSPSAHPIAQLQNLYIPLASILAGVLPLSTGPKSYTSPLMCNMFIRGVQRIDRGMITSVVVTRGVTNLPYNKSRRPLGIDITFTVTDFSDIISAPTPSDLLSSGSVLFDDESGLSRYIQSLCARDLYSTTHVFDKGKLKLSRWFQAHNLQWTPEYIGAAVGDTFAGTGMFNMFSNNKAVNYSELY